MDMYGPKSTLQISPPPIQIRFKCFASKQNFGCYGWMLLWSRLGPGETVFPILANSLDEI